jgi:hypothetical protein
LRLYFPKTYFHLIFKRNNPVAKEQTNKQTNKHMTLLIKLKQLVEIIPSVPRLVVKMGKNFQVVLEFKGLIVYVNNGEVGDPFY